MYLLLRGDAAETLTDAHESGNPLCRVPATSPLVSTHLPDTNRGGAQTRLFRCACEELLRHPLALAVTSANGKLWPDVDGLSTRSGPGVICGESVSAHVRHENSHDDKRTAHGRDGADEESARSTRYR